MSESFDPEQKSNYEKTNRIILQASLYLAAFAVLENTVIVAIELSYGVKDSASPQWKNYVSNVLTYSDDMFESSCIWLLKRGVIKDEHYQSLMNCKHRSEGLARGFSDILFQDIFSEKDDEIIAPSPTKVTIDKTEFEVMIDLMHRVEAWRARNDLGLAESNDDDDLESIFPVSVIGMIRIAALAFPTSPET